MYRGLVEIGLVDDFFSSYIERFWEKGKPIVESARRELDYSEYGGWFEYLYNEMQKRQQKQ